MTEFFHKALSVNTIVISFPGYPMSYIELTGTLFYLASVWLIARRNMWTWPTGIISVVLFFLLFYQIRLYSDALEQIYYLGACVYGWWYWKRGGDDEEDAVSVTISDKKAVLLWACATLVLSVVVSRFMANAHLTAPLFFPEPASYPFIDALTTVMSFTAMFLMARKRTESWVYWIIVDVIGVWLYYIKQVKVLSVLYIILLGIAINGLRVWLTAMKSDAVGAEAGNRPLEDLVNN